MRLSFVRKSKYLLCAAVCLVAIIAGGMLTSNLIMGQTTPTFESQGTIYGRAYNDAPNSVFIKVNDYEVNYREYAELRERFSTNLSNHKIQIEGVVPTEQWTKPQGESKNEPTRPLPEFMVTLEFKQMVNVMNKHGVDAGALGGLILDYARYSTAVDEGFDMSDDVLASEVTFIRELYEKNVEVSQQGELGEFKGYISVVGEDAFWGGIYPAKLRMMIVVGDWRIHAFREAGGTSAIGDKDRNDIMAALDQQVLEKVRVQVMDDSQLKVTPAEGLDYMREYNEIMHRFK